LAAGIFFFSPWLLFFLVICVVPAFLGETHFAFLRNLNKELTDSGELIANEGLAGPEQAKVVRAGKSGTPVTDGVFPESKEFLAGYWIIDVESAEQAYRIAARASAAPGPDGIPGSMPIEVRPVMSGAPKEWLE
jgi:hypothetical protein